MKTRSRTRSVRLLAGTIATLLAATVPAFAHDWWLESPVRVAPVGTSIDVAAVVGVAWSGDRVKRDPRRIRRFVAHDAVGERVVEGEPGADPLGTFALRGEGTTVVAFESEPARLFLRAPDFETYLREEGLERIVTLRAQRGHSGRAGIEQYFRCAKALIRTPGAALTDRAIGLPLELVAKGDLTTLAAGGRLEVEVRWQGEPLAGVRVVAVARERPDAPIAACSDAAGRVAFELPAGGRWLVKAVNMVPAPAETRLDWESWWASLTFDAAGFAGATTGS
ncbi:MAG: DUF4198 domain-containing protein [Planctomycetes bacterium]|nr:DUF4198 domain-containing protein [Planctomycetota bacterium]